MLCSVCRDINFGEAGLNKSADNKNRSYYYHYANSDDLLASKDEGCELCRIIVDAAYGDLEREFCSDIALFHARDDPALAYFSKQFPAKSGYQPSDSGKEEPQLPMRIRLQYNSNGWSTRRDEINIVELPGETLVLVIT
jgi:hypothetical protein